jgi:hypothetical protein
MISALKYAISRDRNYFVKAAVDPMYKNIRPQIDSLLNNILEETRKNVQIQVSNLEKHMKKMEKWFSGNYASSEEVQLYNRIKHKIKEIYSKLSLNSYYAYDDALQLAFSAREEINTIQLSIKNTLLYSEKRIQINETTLKNNSIAFSTTSHEYNKDMLKDLFWVFSVPIAYILVIWWITKNIFSGVGSFILALILGFIGIILSQISGIMSLGSAIAFFDKNKKRKADAKRMEDNNKNMKNEIITLNQKIAIAKESII